MTEPLSLRERQALLFWSCGWVNKTIASDWGCSVDTVKEATRRARMKLGARHTTHAVAIALIGEAAMTERANRAAEELRRRGWQIDAQDGALDKQCLTCGYQMRSDSRYCQNCGAQVAHDVADDSLADIEAAIAAALKEKLL